MKIQYALPGLWNHFEITQMLINYMKVNPKAVRDNVSIGAVYDNFPYCIWDGGRIFSQPAQASAEDIAAVKQFFNDEGIPIRLVFTNPELKPEHFYDRFCNLVCSICEDEMNEIVVNNSVLEEYLRETYPKFSFISSTTKCNIFNDSLTEINSNDYKYICLDYNQNHNFKALETISEENKQKVEFLCNAICPSGCPHRKEHYRLNGLYYLGYLKSYSINCNLQHNTLDPEARNYKNTISPDEIETYYAPNGFSMFKLEGRSLSTFEVLCTYAHYLIKPEYQQHFLNDMLIGLQNPLTSLK